MGLCESCEKIRFELTAQNKLDMRIPDNSGRQLKATLIGKTDLHVDKTFAKSLTHPPLEEIILSNDAGTYLCNETYYRTLESLKIRLLVNQLMLVSFISRKKRLFRPRFD